MVQFLFSFYRSHDPFADRVRVSQSNASSLINFVLFALSTIGIALWTGFAVHSFMVGPPITSLDQIDLPSSMQSQSASPIGRLVIAGSPVGLPSCTLNSTFVLRSTNGLTSSVVTPLDLQSRFGNLDQVVPSLLLDIFGTVDSQSNSVVAVVAPPDCAFGAAPISASTRATISVTTSDASQTASSFTSRRLESYVDSFGGIQIRNPLPSISNVVVALQYRLQVELTIFVTQRVSSSDAVSYTLSLGSPVTTSVVGYPDTAIIIRIRRTVDVIKERSQSLQTLVGSIAGAWGTIFLFGRLIAELLRRLFQLDKRQMNKHSHSPSAAHVELSSSAV